MRPIDWFLIGWIFVSAMAAILISLHLMDRIDELEQRLEAVAKLVTDFPVGSLRKP